MMSSSPRLPRRLRWLLRLLAVLPPFLFLVFAGLFLARAGRLVQAAFVPVATAELGKVIGHEVRVGSLRYATPGVLEVNGIAVSSRKTFASSGGETAVRADKVLVRYNWRALLFDSGNAAHAVERIDLYRPDALVERFSDHYNFSDLIRPRPKRPGQKPFSAVIVAHDGTARFRDYLAPKRGARPAFNTLVGVNAVVDFRSERLVAWDGSGRGTAGRVGAVSVAGAASRRTAGQFRVQVHALDADAVYWSNYLVALKPVRLAAGRADADFFLSRLRSAPKGSPPVPLDFLGRLSVRDVEVAVSNRALLRENARNITGAITFTRTQATFDGALSLAGQPLSAHGLLLDFSHPQLSFAAASPRLDIRRLSVALPALRALDPVQIAPGAISARISGPLSAPRVAISGAFPAATYAGNRLADVRAEAVYADKILTVPVVTGRLAGGTATVRLTVDTRGPKAVVKTAGQADGVNLALLRLPPTLAAKRLQLGGRAAVAFLGSNVGQPLTFTADVTVVNPRVRQTMLAAARGRVVWSPNRSLTLAGATVTDAGGRTATVSGMVPVGQPGGRYDLQVSAAGLDLNALLRSYTRLDVGGLAGFQGTISGPADNPQASGLVQLNGARYGRYAVDAARGRVTASLSRIAFENVVVRRFPASARISGTVTLPASSNPGLNLSVKLSRGDVQDFLSLATEAVPPRPRTKAGQTVANALPSITGTAEGAFRIAGSVQSPRIMGEATVTDGTIADPTLGAYRIELVKARLAYQDDTLRIDNGQVRVEGATATARGVWRRKTGQISGIFASDQLDLSVFRRALRPYADARGTVNLSGQILGTVSSPRIALALVADGATINGQRLGPTNASLLYNDGVLQSRPDDPWRIAIASAPGLSAPVRYVVNTLRLVLPTAGHPNRPPSLTLDAQIPADAPERLSHVVQTLRDALDPRFRLAQTPGGQALARRLDTLPVPLLGTVAVPSLSLRGPLAALTIAARLDGGDLQIGRVSAASAGADVTARTGGNPAVRVSGQGRTLRAAGVDIDNLEADAAYANRVVTVRRFRAERGETALFADPERPAVVDLDGQTSVSLEADNVPLSLLRAVLPESAAARLTTGRIKQASLVASGPTRFQDGPNGTTLAPDLTGSFTIDRLQAPGAEDGKAPRYTLRSGAITVSGSPDARLLSVSRLDAFRSGPDGETVQGAPLASVSGALPIPWPGANAADGGARPIPAEPFTATVRDLSVLALFVPGLDAVRTQGTLTAQLTLTNRTGAKSLLESLTGTVTLTGGAVGLRDTDTSLADINGTLRLADGRAALETPLTGHPQSRRRRAGPPGTVTLSGSAPLTKAGKFDLRLALREFRVDEAAALRAYNSNVRGKISGDILVTDTLDAPLVATPAQSPLRVTEASGAIPTAPAPPEGRIGRPVTIEGASAPGASDGATEADIRAALTGLNEPGLSPGDLYDPRVAARGRALLLATNEFPGGVRVSAQPGAAGVVNVTYTVARQRGIVPRFAVDVALGSPGRTVTVSDALLSADARGLVKVRGDAVAPRLTADLALVRGSFFLPPSTRLAFVPPTGELTLAYPGATAGDAPGDEPGLAQYVDMTGQANVSISPAELAAVSSATQGGGSSSSRLTGGNFDRPQRYRISVHIRGQLGGDPDKLQLEYSSSPPGLTRSQMQAALVQQGAYSNLLAGGSGAENAIKQQIGLAFNAFVIPSLLRPIETGVAQAFNLSSFSVDYSPDAPVLVTLSKSLLPRLEVTYLRSFGARTPGAVNALIYQPQYRVKLGYSLSNRLQVSLSTDDQRNNTLALEGVFGF